MKENKSIYNNNPNLPTARAEHEYTPELIKQLKKAKTNLLYFAEEFYTIIDPDVGKSKIELRPYQKRMLRNLRDNRFNIFCCSRQIGKTTVMAIFALWWACFNKDQRILIVANKEGTAIEIFSRVRMAYEQLPNWIKPGIDGEYGKTSMVLANGSKISISTTTGTAARGQSCNCVIGSEIVTVKDKKTNTIFDISMSDLSHILKENGELKVYIPDTE